MIVVEHVMSKNFVDLITGLVNSRAEFFLVVSLADCLACEEFKRALNSYSERIESPQPNVIAIEIGRLRDLRQLNLAVQSFPTVIKYSNGKVVAGWAGMLDTPSIDCHDHALSEIFS
jgi:hypothetical protein